MPADKSATICSEESRPKFFRICSAADRVAAGRTLLPRYRWLPCSDAQRPVRLAQPIDYKAVDGQSVDLVFMLLSPPDAGAEHLKSLAAISRLVRHAGVVEKLRGARTRDALAAVLIGAEERDAA